MRFASPRHAKGNLYGARLQMTLLPRENQVPFQLARSISVLPLVGVAMVPAVVVLTLACVSFNRAEETVRLPAGIMAQPPVVGESPNISLRISREGSVTLAGQVVADNARPAV